MTLRHRQLAAHAALACALALALLLRTFPPAACAFYPRCPVYTYLHLLCPGCGGTRAIAALLHGRLADAWRFNPLVTAALPFALAFLAASYRRALQAQPFAWPNISNPMLAAWLVLACAFTFFRNLHS